MPPSRRSAAHPLLALCALLAALAAAPAVAAGPEPPPPAAAGFSEAIDVDVVEVEAFVTDRSGKPVTGLSRGDFELRVDGEPVPIANFYAAAAAGPAAPVPGGATAAQTAAGAAAVTPAASAGLAEDRRLNLTIFIDNLNLTPEARNQALQSLAQFFRGGLRREDRVLVASYNGKGLTLRRPAAGDARAVVAALTEVAGRGARGGLAAAERRKGLEDLGNATRAAEAEAAAEDLAEVAREREGDAHTVLVTLGRLVDSLAGLRGRKALLYLTGELAVPDGDAFLSGLARRANAAGVTFYGLGAPEDLAGVAFDTTKVDYLTTPAFQARADDLRSTLEAVALPTGGLAGVDLNRPAALLDRIRDDFSSSYSLGFAPGPGAEAAGSRPHRLEVRVPGRRGLTVRFPASYVHRSREERLADRTQAALALDTRGGFENPLGVRLGFERDELAAYGRREVTVLVTVPFSRLTLEPGAGASQGRIVLFLAARDSTGQSRRMRRIAIPVHVADGELEATRRKSVAYRLKLELPPGAATLALGVRDELGGAESTVAASYVAGALATARAAGPRPAPPGAR